MTTISVKYDSTQTALGIQPPSARLTEASAPGGKIVLLTAPVCFPDMPPLGPAYLVASLRQSGFACSIVDLNVKLYNDSDKTGQRLWNSAENQNFWLDMASVEHFYQEMAPFFEQQLAMIIAESPDCIGFSTWFTNANMSFVLAREIKKLIPAVRIIFGGPEVTRMHRMQGLYADHYRENIDLFIAGEGELILPVVAAHAGNLERLASLPDIAYQPDLKLASSLLTVDLNTLPPPDYTLHDLGAYRVRGMLPLSTSRGCVNQCIYCDEKKLWSGFRSRSAEKIFQDVVETKRRHPEFSYVDFADSLINGDIRILRKFACLMSESALQIKWAGNVVLRPEMTSELLDLMAKGGCVRLIYGLETVSKKVLKNIGKIMAVKTDIAGVIRATAGAGIPAEVNFMFGLPGETEEDAMENIDFLSTNRAFIHAAVPSFAFCNICPGTDAHDDPERFDIKPNPNPCFWESMDGTNTYPIRLARFERFVKFLYDHGIHSNYPYPEFLQRDRMLAQHCLYKGDIPKACEHLEEAILREPDDQTLRATLDALRQSAAASVNSRNDSAGTCWDMFAGSSQASPEELVCKGEDRFNAGDIAGAIRFFSLSLKKKPEHPEALNNLGVCYFVSNEFHKAALLFSKCLEVAPYHQAAADNLHLLHEQTR